MSTATTKLAWTIPAEVQAFAEEQGVAACLPAVLEATQRLFPTAQRCALVVEEDPEIANDRHIVIEVDVALSVKDSLVRHRKWHEAVLQCCPTTLICVFRLSLELVD